MASDQSYIDFIVDQNEDAGKNTFKKVVVNWSGGKDSALCLQKILLEEKFEIVTLLTTISQPYQRVSMHGVRVELLDIQAERIGLPLVKVPIPDMPTMETYEKTMSDVLMDLKNQGVTGSVFGDIFLEDLRRYREEQLAKLNLKWIFPLWKIPTHELIRRFIDLGFKAITTCVHEKYLEKSFVGRIIDDDFLADLPAGVDPCGENGEYHSFVFDGPIFAAPIPFKKGEIVYRTYSNPTPTDQPNSTDTEKKESPFDSGFWYCDLLAEAL
jgi:uncharacterized protein (TIGR00290 family)